MKKISPNFSKDYPLWEACDFDNDLRTSLRYIKFENGYAYATNAYVIVKAKLSHISDFEDLDLANLEGKYIHGNSFKKIVKSKGIVTITNDAIVVEEENYTISYPLKTQLEIRFPDCEKVMQRKEKVTFQKEFGVKCTNLNILHKAMHCYHGLRMEWVSSNMFKVTPISPEIDICGMVMTIMVN